MFARRSMCQSMAVRIVRPSLNRVVQSRLLSSYPPHAIVGMPALSPTMESGTMGKWLCKPGDKITPGFALAEIETDKASMAFEAQDEFVIAKLLVDVGAEVKIGDPIFVSVEDASSVGAFSNYVLTAGASPPAAVPKAAAPTVAVEAPKQVAAPAPIPTAAVVPAAVPAASAPKPAVAVPVAPVAVPAAPARAKPTTPAAAAAPTATAPSNVYAMRWGSAVGKSALAGKLAASHAKYIEQYGRCAQKPM